MKKHLDSVYAMTLRMQFSWFRDQYSVELHSFSQGNKSTTLIYMLLGKFIDRQSRIQNKDNVETVFPPSTSVSGNDLIRLQDYSTDFNNSS